MSFFVRHSAVTVLFLQGLREVLRENVGKKYYLTYKIGLKKWELTSPLSSLLFMYIE